MMRDGKPVIREPIPRDPYEPELRIERYHKANYITLCGMVIDGVTGFSYTVDCETGKARLTVTIDPERAALCTIREMEAPDAETPGL